MKYLFTLLMALTCVGAFAQWTTDTAANTLVADAESGDMQALGTSTGMTYVVFWKPVVAPTNYELRLQILDALGNQTLGPDGQLVSTNLPMSTFTVIWNIAIDASNNLYIGCTGTGGGDPAFLFKFDTSGNPQYGANGVQVGSGNVVTPMPLSNGGALVGWYGSSGAVMQEYDNTGTAVWPSAQPLEVGASDTVPAQFFQLSGGDYLAVYHKQLGGINSHLYAQRYDSNGDPIWGSPLQIANQATAFNRSYSYAQDGDACYVGYFGSTGVRFDSFLQRVDANGTLPWGINGSDFDTNQTDYETYTSIAFDPSSSSIWSVCSYTNTSQSEVGEYVQKFDKTTGARGLTDNAKQVYAIGSDNVHAGALQLMDDSPLFLLKKGFDNGATPVTLDVVYLDANGDFAWPEESRPVATFSAHKSRIQYTKPANHQSVAVFIENKGSGDRIYAQNFLDEELGVTEQEVFNVRFTNPVKEWLHVQSEVPLVELTVYNVLGRALVNKSLNGLQQVSLPVPSWTSGFYFLKLIDTQGRSQVVQVVKE